MLLTNDNSCIRLKLHFLSYPLTESALFGFIDLSCWDLPELDPSRDFALFEGGPSLWRPCETVLIILRTEYRKSNSPLFSIVNTRVFFVLMSMAPKLMSLTGETAYLLYTERTVILMGMLAITSPPSPRWGSTIWNSQWKFEVSSDHGTGITRNRV